MSVGQVIGAVAGAVVGYFAGPQAGFATYAAVSGVASYLTQPDNIGPRLEDLRVQMSSYGANIPFEWGANRHAGTIIWPQTLDAVEHRHEESAKGGPSNVTFTYTLSCAVLVCEGQIAGIRRIWANKKIVYDVSAGNAGATQDPAIGSIRFYLGTETQAVDPLIEATDGASPAYRGYAYVVFENYDVTELRGRPPQWEFEVITEGSSDIPPLHPISNGGYAAFDPATGYLWSTYNVYDFSTDFGIPVGVGVVVVNPVTETIVTHWPLADHPTGIAYNPAAQEMWVGNAIPMGVATVKWGWRFSTASLSLLGTIPVDSATYNDSVGFGPGNIVYDPSYSEGVAMAFWDGNLGGVGWAIQVLSGHEYPYLEQRYGYASSAVLDITPAGDFSCFAMQNYGGALQMHSSSQDSPLDPVYPVTGPLPECRLAWDEKRHLFWVLAPSTRTLFTISPAGTFTEIAVLSFLDTTTSSSGHGYATALAYDAERDSLWVTTEISSGVGDLLEVSTSLTAPALLQSIAGHGPLRIGGLGSRLARVPGKNKLIAWGLEIAIIPFGGALAPQQVTLASIVSDISARAGLSAGDIDVTQLTDMVDGYIVPHQMSARAAIEPLQAAFYFDAVESDDKIKFVKRGGASVVTIPEAERAAHEHGQAMPDALSIVRAFELELPFQCDVEYPDVDSDHLVGNQYDRRITKDTKQKINLQLPIVMTAAKAKEIARVTLYQAWLNQTYRWTTTRKYAKYEPTDTVDLPTTNALYHARITTKREQPNGVIEWEAKMEGVEVYTQSGADAAPTNYVPQIVFSPDPTVLALLDIPLLRDEDDNAGFYVAMGGQL